jgi:hypothetical protein
VFSKRFFLTMNSKLDSCWMIYFLNIDMVIYWMILLKKILRRKYIGSTWSTWVNQPNL